MSDGKRSICYVSGTRADFGLMQSTLQLIAADPALHLDVVATGMHLSDRFGMTIREIVAAGLHIAAEIPVDIDTATGAAMARNLAATLAGSVTAFERIRPDLILLLGDRGEMLAGALAAIHLNIPIAHIHGGERSGTVDEPVRHAISKLSHLHFVTSDNARNRLVRMGEREDRIFVTGAPGLDGITALATSNRVDLCAEVGFDPAGRLALLVYHPVLQEAGQSASQTRNLVEACLAHEIQVMALMPNSDAGGEGVREVLGGYVGHAKIRVETHLPRQAFISWMAACDLMIGNSSSGIIEAASFGTPVINVGMRQNLRERNDNVLDVPGVLIDDTVAAIGSALQHGRYPTTNIYGDGTAGHSITGLLRSVELGPALVMKANTY